MKRLSLFLLAILAIICCFVLVACQPGVKGYIYDIFSDEVWVLVEGGVDEIIIPETVEGKPVTKVILKSTVDMVIDVIKSGSYPISYFINAALPDNQVKKLYIPEHVNYVESGIFTKLQGIESIEVHENNQHFKSVDGNLYSKDGKKLIRYAVAKKESSFYVPDEVEEIGENAFKIMPIIEMDWMSLTAKVSYLDALKSVRLPLGLKTIGKSAFGGYSSITSIIVPNSVTSIGDFAFTNTGIVSVALPSGLEMLGKNAFSSCQNLKSVQFRGAIEVISEGAFSYCNALEEIVIPEGTLAIEKEAFYNCFSLKNVSIPNSLQTIGTRAFAETPNLLYWIHDGVMYLGNDKNYYHAAMGTYDKLTDYFLHSDTVTIAGGAFDRDDKTLKKVYFNDNLLYLSPSAFAYCPNLEGIYFAGTVDAWEALYEKSDGVMVERDFSVHCLDGEIQYDVTLDIITIIPIPLE